MFPMSGVGFMGRGGGVIPTPEAGVCTPYPIAIPVTSGLIHYSSPFNWCDQYNDLAGTTPLAFPPANQLWRNSEDLSGNNNPQIPRDSLDLRRILYEDLGDGDVYWRGGSVGGSTTRTEIDTSWVIGASIKTIIVLAKAPNTTTTSQKLLLGSSGATRFWFQLLADNTFSIRDGGVIRPCTLVSDLNYRVYSIRCDATMVAGLDQSYEQIKASPVIANATPIAFWGLDEFNAVWASTGRDLAIYDRALSDTEVDTMVDYMKAKWNL